MRRRDGRNRLSRRAVECRRRGWRTCARHCVGPSGVAQYRSAANLRAFDRKSLGGYYGNAFRANPLRSEAVASPDCGRRDERRFPRAARLGRAATVRARGSGSTHPTTRHSDHSSDGARSKCHEPLASRCSHRAVAGRADPRLYVAAGRNDHTAVRTTGLVGNTAAAANALARPGTPRHRADRGKLKR